MGKRPSNRKPYTIAYLLSKQPKTLQKNRHYPEMLFYYQSSRTLQKLRMNRRCYGILQRATIKPENLANLYRTYRLPKDPFFPLFLRIKRDYRELQERRRTEKMKYIAGKMRELPEEVLSFIKYLAVFEQQYNPAGGFPLWTTRLFPVTKKLVHRYCAFSREEWITFFDEFLDLLRDRYESIDEAVTARLLASFVLGFSLREGPLVPPSEGEIKKRYRRMSKIHHPDRGGDPRYFIRLQWARETLTTPH